MAENRMFGRSSFTFIGGIVTSKELVTTNKLSDTSEWSRTRLNFGIKNDNNTQFLNMEYIHSPKVKTTKIFFEDGSNEDVKFEDTCKPSIISRVSEMNRIVVDLEQDFDKKSEYTKLMFKKRNHDIKEEKTDDDLQKIEEYSKQINELATNRVEFAHIKDVIKFMESSIPMIKDHKIKVTGTVKSNYYNGKNNLQYIPQRIELVPEDTENQLKVYLDFFYDKDGIDDDVKEKRMIVNGYIGERVKKADKLYPLVVVLDYTKIDTEIEQHQQLLDFMKKTFRITNRKQVHKMGLELNILNGSQVVEWDENCLTDDQKMAVALGLSKAEDFKPKGFVYGSRITELRLAKPNVKAYPEFGIEVFPINDLSDYMVADDSDKKISEVKDTPKEEPKQEDKKQESAEDLMAKLFGN